MSGNVISVKFVVSRSDKNDKLFRKDGGSVHFKVDVSKDPLTMKVQLGGPLLRNGLKWCKRPVCIKIDIDFDHCNAKFNAVSKELSFPLNNTEEAYMFEDEVALPWPEFYLTTASSRGTLTCQLLDRSASATLSDDVATSKKILHDKIRCDFALIAENGKSIPCHTSFLASHSKVFLRMFETDCKEAKEKAYQMRLTEEAVNALLKFLYYSDLDDAINNPSISLELLQVAHEYDILLLEKALKRMLLRKSSDWYDTDFVVHLFQYALKLEGYEDLKEKAVKVIRTKSESLYGSAACDQLFKEDPESGKVLFLLCLRK
ncbi:BTB/POZ domain-containing protein [Orchesella cincta]|uniref:BTB/POZ domain-containing protein n=1 Tax=Orchesella cincta TaxID=48709 RepID=A0A1D2M9T0_ORCCI|nr:BTB/POZ domain-containing protein [Orchesella cincta]